MFKKLDYATSLIDRTLYLNKGNVLPYFFVIGAGVSAPEVPTSATIVDLCKKEVEKMDSREYEKCLIDTEQYIKNSMKYYSSWIECAYPNKFDRSRFFKNLIKSSKISSANLMLAQILYSKKIATTVITTNFDDKLKQSLDLIGMKDVFVAANRMDNLVVNSHNKEIQIIHVHGTYNFYDCANLEKEISDVSRASDIVSSARIVEDFLRSQAPIIVGYSGWENDVIMSRIKERLKNTVPYKYIWVCYSKEAYLQLPKWLIENDNIEFVYPFIHNDDDCRKEGKSIKNRFLNSGIDEQANFIQATMFFSKLIAKFKIEVPKLFTNPSLYYSEMLSKVLPYDQDVLHLRHWGKRMECLETSQSQSDKLVKLLDEASIGKNFEVAIDTILKMSNIDINDADIKFICETLFVDIIKSTKMLSSFELKLKLHNEILNFIENKKDKLISANTFNNTLRLALLMYVKESEKTNCLEIIERVYRISGEDVSLLNIHLMSIGAKADIASDNKEKIQLLTKLIDQAEADTASNEILVIKYQALLELCQLTNSEATIELLSSAKSILRKLKKNKVLEKLLILTKSTILGNIDSKDVKLEYIKEIFSTIENDYLDKDALFVTKVISEINYTKLNDNIIDSELEARIIKIVRNSANIELNNCNNANLLAEANFFVCYISEDDKVKKEFCERIFALDKYFHDECKAYKEIICRSVFIYCSIASAYVTDMMKIEAIVKVKKIKDDSPTYKKYYYSSVQNALENGDYENYNRADILDGVQYAKEAEIFNFGVEKYKNGNMEEAQSIFFDLFENGCQDIKENSAMNLAFMIRRNEIRTAKYGFLEMMGNISENSAIKLINIILWKASQKQFDDKYDDIISQLHALPEGELASARKWWNDEKVVGEFEKNVVIDLLNQKNIEEYYRVE